MRIAFITEDLGTWDGVWHPGGCAYYRQLLPSNAAGPYRMFGRPAWSGQHGYGVQYQDGMAQFGFDVVSLKMIMARWTVTQMRQAQALGQTILVDVDDHYDGLHEANRAHKSTDPTQNPIHNRAHHAAVIQQADIVTVSTPFLYDYYKDKVRDVRLMRNGINPNQFHNRKVKNHKPIIGWAGATGWRSNDVEILRPWLNDFLTKHDLMFHHAGHEDGYPSFGELAGIDPQRMIVTGMEPLPSYASMLTFDIGIVPLSDIPFNRAKSAIKGLEYAASGIPFVASALPEYRRLEDMGVGRTATYDSDWVRELEYLLDYKTRRLRAAAHRHKALRDHTIKNTAHDWAALFGELAARPPAELRTVRIPYIYR